MIRRAVWPSFALAIASMTDAPPVFAHGTAERYDLPLPLGYYVAGSALVVALSFVVTAAFFYREPRVDPYPRLDLFNVERVRVPLRGALAGALQTLGVFALAAVIATGLFGNQHPAKNLAPTLVWVAWWVGLSLFVALIANVWPALNPWHTLSRLIDRVRVPVVRAYPVRLAEWPAVGALLAFVWIELVSPYASSPRALAVLALAYTAATLAAMRVYGREAWLAHGEAFTLVFNLLGRFAPIALLPAGACDSTSSDRTLAVRPPSAGLLGAEAPSNAVVTFLLLLLSAVLLDGLLGTAFWRAIERSLPSDRDGLFAATLGLVGIWAVFLGAYVGACAAMAAMTGGHTPVPTLLRRYALTLVPIAVGYAIAHNFSYLLVQAQTLVALASDPFGWGWNLFGTAGFEPDVGIVDARTTWRVAIAAIVIGHVMSVVLAHIVALRTEPTRRSALLGLAPLTLVMMVYTAVSLSIIADPLVRFRTPDPDYSTLNCRPRCKARSFAEPVMKICVATMPWREAQWVEVATEPEPQYFRNGPNRGSFGRPMLG
jgi:hypothetical protein